MPRLRKLLALGGLAAGAAAVLRNRRSGSSTPAPASATPSPAPATPSPAPDPASAAAPVAATPPPDAPGPSVSPAGNAASDTERAERADRTTPDPELLRDRAGGPVDALVEEETNAAAAEAGRIGGPGASEGTGDPALEPVYEAGGGEQEGFEQSEDDLIEAASHGDSAPDPSQAAFRAEEESDLSTARYGEPDEEDVTEVVRDPQEKGDDPGEGPGVAADR
jgi:hypothetical protein